MTTGWMLLAVARAMRSTLAAASPRILQKPAMQIDAATAGSFLPHAASPTPVATSPSQSSTATFADILAQQVPPVDDSSEGSEETPLRFDSMTRQELFDWMNQQLRSGNMSFEDSTAFLGMTIKFDAATGQMVDMQTDTTRHNFLATARDGLAGALWRHDQPAADRLQRAIDIMLADPHPTLDA